MRFALAFVAVTALSPVAVAGPKVDPRVQRDADKKFVDGQTAYQEGKYQAAITLFKNAYELVRDPIYLFNIAQSYRRIADCVAAYEHYVKYLDALPKADNRKKVEQWIMELKPCYDKAREREEEAERANEEAERQRRAAEEAQSRPRPVGDPVETEVDRGGALRVAGIGLAGLGVLGVVVGAVYSVKGNGIESDIHDMCSPPNTCAWDSPEIQSLHDDGESANTRAAIGYIGGGIALAGGMALYMIGRNRVETVWITPTAGGAAVGASVRF